VRLLDAMRTAAVDLGKGLDHVGAGTGTVVLVDVAR